jgi:hypothetical protein
MLAGNPQLPKAQTMHNGVEQELAAIKQLGYRKANHATGLPPFAS